MQKTYFINKEFVNTRIDRWFKKNVCEIPQSLIERKLRNGNIKVDNFKVKSSYKLKLNNKIFLTNFDPKIIIRDHKKKYIPPKKEVFDSSRFIVENNVNFAIINKPQGLAVQSGTKSRKNLIDIIAKNRIFLKDKPYAVHRIDKDTSGILIVAKNRKYAQLFTTLFRIRKIYKSYLSICLGAMENNKGQLKNELVRIDGKKKIYEKAITNFTVLDKNSQSTLILLNPITGRKHQIRKQLALLGHPIYGDSKYNFSRINRNKNNYLMLHAYAIKFIINGKKFEYTVNIPNYFKRMLISKKLKLFKDF